MVRVDIPDIDHDEVGNAAGGARVEHVMCPWLVEHENRVTEAHVGPRQIAGAIPHFPFPFKPERLNEKCSNSFDVFVAQQKRSHSPLRFRVEPQSTEPSFLFRGRQPRPYLYAPLA